MSTLAQFKYAFQSKLILRCLFLKGNNRRYFFFSWMHADTSLSGSTEYEVSDQRVSGDSGSSGETHGRFAGHPHGTARHSNDVLRPVPVKPSATRYRSSDLDSLASHRRSHAAETGQLLPRVRVNDGAGEWASVQQPAEHQNFLSDRSVSPIGSTNDPFATPQTTPLMAPSQESSRGPPSFEEFVRSTSPQGQYYLGEEGIPLQQQSVEGDRGYNSRPVYQPFEQQRNEQNTAVRKASSFSEAV